LNIFICIYLLFIAKVLKFLLVFEIWDEASEYRKALKFKDISDNLSRPSKFE